VTTPGFQTVAGRFSTIQASLVRARETLAAEARESPRVRYGLRAVAPPAAEAREALVDVAGKVRYTDVRATLREVEVVARESASAEAELGLVEGRTTVLADGAASSTGGLTEEDLRGLGSGLSAGQPPPQIQWTEAAVNAACERGRAQGGVTDAEGQAHFELAGRRLEGAPGPAALGAADLAAALKEAGVALEKVDPQQLDAAARYVSAATSGTEQRDRLRKTLDGFQTLARIGAPRLSRQEMVDQLWAAVGEPIRPSSIHAQAGRLPSRKVISFECRRRIESPGASRSVASTLRSGTGMAIQHPRGGGHGMTSTTFARESSAVRTRSRI
jgi:hypothetical protein